MADVHFTPPTSPDVARQPGTRQGPQLHIPTMLKRTKACEKVQTASRQIPITVKRSYVSETKIPFPLLLPESPIDNDYSSTDTISPISQPELRRVSASYHDLRFIAAHQSSSKQTPLSTLLLPNPIVHDTVRTSQLFFQSQNPRLPRSTGDYKSYEDLHILSCYCDESRSGSMEEIEKQLNDDTPSHGSLTAEDRDSDSTEIEEMPETPKDKVGHNTCLSEESNWLASTRSHEERVRRLAARCYQIVQRPVRKKTLRREEDQIVSA